MSEFNENKPNLTHTTYLVSLNVSVSSERSDLSEREVLDLASKHIATVVNGGDYRSSLEWYDTEEPLEDKTED